MGLFDYEFSCRYAGGGGQGRIEAVIGSKEGKGVKGR